MQLFQKDFDKEKTAVDAPGNLIHKEMCSRTLNVNTECEHKQANAAQFGS